MKRIEIFLTLIMASAIILNGHSQKMNDHKLIKHLKTECDSISGEDGNYQLFYRGIVVLAVIDKESDRLKLLSPIVYLKDINEDEITKCLEANFDNLQKIKYAVSNDIIWSIYDNSYKKISTTQIDEALLQLYYSTGTFGGKYSSSDTSIAQNK